MLHVQPPAALRLELYAGHGTHSAPYWSLKELAGQYVQPAEPVNDDVPGEQLVQEVSPAFE